MKSFLALLALLLTGLPAAAQHGSHTADEEAIKKVVRAETKAYFDRDVESWRDVWLHDERTSRTIGQINPSTQRGWEAIESAIQRTMERSPDPIPVERKEENFVILTDGNMAWVEYDQTMVIPGNPLSPFDRREMRGLKKENGTWRIFKQVSFPRFASDVEATEMALNETGYTHLFAGDHEKAIEIFKLNVKLYPESWNVYDSLGEAYMEAGNRKLAIKNYKKSVELNLKNIAGIEALEKLRSGKLAKK